MSCGTRRVPPSAQGHDVTEEGEGEVPRFLDDDDGDALACEVGVMGQSGVDIGDFRKERKGAPFGNL